MTATPIEDHRQPHIAELVNGQWRIWIAYNKARSAGTYLTLHSDGTITQETVQPTGEVSMTIDVTKGT